MKKTIESKRIIFTGGPGFLGIHLCDCVGQASNNVLREDNFLSGAHPSVEHLLDRRNF
jgi:UDP-glucose 4-epimerase